MKYGDGLVGIEYSMMRIISILIRLRTFPKTLTLLGSLPKDFDMGYNTLPPQPIGETRRWYRYDKKCAIFPILCRGRSIVWFGNYYCKYIVYSYKEINDVSYFVCRLTEADCIVDRLIEGL
jgi:hypothetical protein